MRSGQTGASERSEYDVIRFDGDQTVKQQVIARYLDAEEQAGAPPFSTVAVTPANYRFRYLGSVENNGTAVCVFQIVPKKKRPGLIRGQIWIDSVTGIAVHQVGRFVKRPSIFIRKIEVRRDTNLLDGLPYTRVTYVAIETLLVGSAELTITERPPQAPRIPKLPSNSTRSEAYGESSSTEAFPLRDGTPPRLWFVTFSGVEASAGRSAS